MYKTKQNNNNKNKELKDILYVYASLNSNNKTIFQNYPAMLYNTAHKIKLLIDVMK